MEGWHLRDDLVHNKGEATIRDSVMFLRNYWECLSSTNPVTSDVKGKQKLHVVNTQYTSLPRHVDDVKGKQNLISSKYFFSQNAPRDLI